MVMMLMIIMKLKMGGLQVRACLSVRLRYTSLGNQENYNLLSESWLNASQLSMCRRHCAPKLGSLGEDPEIGFCL